jgi:organic radical activating enzyme
MLNKQIPIKSHHNPDGRLSVHSIFYTIQGEGPFAGEPAVFVRLAGCNLQCPQCDTEYTGGAQMGLDEVIEQIVNDWTIPFVNPLVVITGGEPFRQNIKPLIHTILHENWRVQIETNGTLFAEGLMYEHPNLTVVCSPKAGKVSAKLEPFIAAYKYVVSSDNVSSSDGLPKSALGLPGRPARPLRAETPIYVNPVDEQDAVTNAGNIQTAVWSCMKFGYRLGLQIHKIIQVP